MDPSASDRPPSEEGPAEFDNPLWISSPLKLTICITERCNLRCRYCYTDCGSRKRPELNTQQWLEVIDDLLVQGFIIAFFEGGEPFVREDFEEIAGYAAKKMFVAVRTNATLVDDARAQRLRDMGVGRVYVDILGATPETHDKLVGVPGSYDRTLSGVKALIRADIPCTPVMIVNRENINELQGLVDLTEHLGLDEVGLLRLYPLGRSRKAWSDFALGIDEQMRALDGVKAPPNIEIMRSWHPNDKNCCWQNAAVNAYGDSIGCPYLRDYVNYGNVLDGGFGTTWRHPLYETLRSGQVTESCPTCSANELSHGGCRSTAYAFRGKWDAPDPYCSHLNAGVDLRVLPNVPLLEEP